MAFKRYYTMHGRLMGEQTEGGSQLTYRKDALGSVVKVVDAGSNVTYTGAYKPNGADLSSTPTVATATMIETGV